MKALLFAILLIPSPADAQVITPSSLNETTIHRHHKTPKQHKQGICFRPSKTRQVNGLSLSFWTRNKNNDSLRINGANIEWMPFGFIFVPCAILGGPYQVIKRPDAEELTDTITIQRSGFYTEIKGVDIRATGGIPVEKMTGLSIIGMTYECEDQTGVAISGVANHATILHGAQLSAFFNDANQGKGLQIGLFNRSTNCRCFQIGLLNRNGTSIQPFVNWHHKKQKQVAENKKRPQDAAGV